MFLINIFHEFYNYHDLKTMVKHNLGVKYDRHMLRHFLLSISLSSA